MAKYQYSRLWEDNFSRLSYCPHVQFLLVGCSLTNVDFQEFHGTPLVWPYNPSSGSVISVSSGSVFWGLVLQYALSRDNITLILSQD